MMQQDRQMANSIRSLAVDAIHKAGSGHVGAALGLADVAYVLWYKFLSHNPKEPGWSARDRFVLSNGHASALLYSLLYLVGYDVSLEDLQSFRQLGSKAAGHPEYNPTLGVETSTGPLAQGLANALGFALAERLMALRFNQSEITVVDNYTYAFVGDGCLMEGLSHECGVLAGKWGLGKLIVFWDDNKVCIDGVAEMEDVAARFIAYNWQVLQVDGHDHSSIERAIKLAQQDLTRPSLLCCKTKIGYGFARVQGTHESHSCKLTDEDVSSIKRALGCNDKPFYVDPKVRQSFLEQRDNLQRYSAWQHKLKEYQKKHPKLYAEFINSTVNKFTNLTDIFKRLPEKVNLNIDADTVALRKVMGRVMQILQEALPGVICGSADLGVSTGVRHAHSVVFKANDKKQANYIHYGAREFAMFAIANGLALYGGIMPVVSTFLVFADYAKSAIRMTSMLNAKSMLVFTHDSIAVGEDGPTHQPFEQLTCLRSLPNIEVWRPCNVSELVNSMYLSLEYSGPSALVLPRQDVPVLLENDNDVKLTDEISKGAYILLQLGNPKLLLLSTGSEVALAVQAAQKLYKLHSIGVRVVSMPCMERFEKQDLSYKEKILTKKVQKRMAIESSSSIIWYRYLEKEGRVVSVNEFGKSGRSEDVLSHYNISVDRIYQEAFDFIGS